MNLEQDALDASQETYGVKIFGQWGEFNSHDPDSSIIYFSANARFSSKPLNDAQTALLRYMVPVRELLDVRDLRFNELLQRDLDDFRVSTELIRYAAGLDRTGGAAFFPPILAVLLPYENDAFADMDPASAQSSGATHILESAPYFRLTRLQPGEEAADSDLSSNSNRRAELAWNDGRSKLVVIDGQHRVMALLALYRTVHNQWAQVPGWKYRTLYEDAVKRLLASESDPSVLSPIPDVELPVTIVLFPKLRGLAIRDAARKLFVDVNQGAKRPSASRLILLSDSDIVNVLTREWLEDVRDQDQLLLQHGVGESSSPLLPAIEYDSPSISEERGSPARPTCVMTLSGLKVLTELLVARNRRFISQINPQRKRDDPQREWWANIKTSLDLLDNFGPLFEFEEDGEQREIALADIVPEQMPREFKSEVAQIFNRTLGALVQGTIRQTEPYRSHLASLQQQRSALAGGGPSQALVSEALFDGVGTFFTLNNLRLKYDEDRRAMRAAHLHEPLRPASADAFEGLESAVDDWFSDYADQLLGAHDSAALNSLKKLTERTHTIAALAGLAMTCAHIVHLLRSVKHESIWTSEKVPSILASAIADCLNQAQSGSNSLGTPLSLILSNGTEKPFNNIPKMDPDNWFEFRCLWLDLLASQDFGFTDSVVSELPEQFSSEDMLELKAKLHKSLLDARERLVEMTFKKYLTPQLKNDFPDSYEDVAFDSACNELLASRSYWFGWSELVFSQQFNLCRLENGSWDWLDSEVHDPIEDDDDE